MASLSLFSLFLFFFFYLRREEVSTSENLLLALVFVAVTLFMASKNKGLIHHSVSIIKHSCFSKSHNSRTGFGNSEPVQWFIGDSKEEARKEKMRQQQQRIVREGVEFYSNGDFYEGEFHKGNSNGSGVYNYFVNGRYEGDWIDGRYDGYGIESWARGSRYKGQYRQGLRHGYGVYRFYTGDSYAGEWFHGQSHGVGVQTCSDGSCYIGEFKCGVKHGLAQRGETATEEKKAAGCRRRGDHWRRRRPADRWFSCSWVRRRELGKRPSGGYGGSRLDRDGGGGGGL